MRVLSGIFTIALAVVLWSSFSPAARADDATFRDWDRSATITVETAWRVPGKILAPGAYILKLMNIGSSRTVVQILSADEKQVFATIIAVPVYNWTRRQKTEFIFGDVKAGEPRPLEAWLFPGNTGLEFVYAETR